MPLHALWSSRFGAEEAARRRHDLLPDIDLRVETNRDRLEPFLAKAQVLIDGRASGKLLDAPLLKHLIVPWAGVPEALRAQLASRPQLRLHNSHYNAPFVAQHALALLLAGSNRIVEADLHLRRGDWRPRHEDAFNSVQLPGLTCLLLGYGAIGQEVRERVAALGMNVTALRRTPQADPKLDKVYGPDALYDALADADVIIVSLPHTPETENLLDHEAFAAMKARAILINVGRAAVIEEEALYHALRERRILAAGLDVWWRYPADEATRATTYPSTFPLHELPNLIMSPHRANQAYGEESRQFDDIAKTLQAILRGETRNEIDLERGY